MKATILGIVVGFLLSLAVFYSVTSWACEDELTDLLYELNDMAMIFYRKEITQVCANSPDCTAKVRAMREKVRTREWPEECAGKDAYAKMDAARFLEKSSGFEKEVGFFEWLFGD